MPLRGRSHWIFDLDGTLTVAVHDFDAIRAELRLPRGRPILETIAELPPAARARVSRDLDDIELRLAAEATAQPGAHDLLDELRARGCALGVLTRNSARNSRETLAAAGLGDYFDPRSVISRDDAPPKPDPTGVRRLLAHWDASESAAVIVGDYVYDLQAGRAAGVATVHLDVDGSAPFSEHADVEVSSLAELHRLLPRAR